MSNNLAQTNTRRQAGAAGRGVLLLVVAVVLLLIISVILFFPRPVPEPGLTPAGTVDTPPASKEARGDAARNIIAELQNTGKAEDQEQTRESEGSADADALAQGPMIEETVTETPEEKEAMNNVQAYTQAQAFRAEGKLADAQLLYYFAARGGYAPAAFDLATFYDPNHFSKETSLMDEPDAFQAYKWYKKSLELGYDGAETRLAVLHAWAEDAADAGNMQADQLLLVWE